MPCENNAKVAVCSTVEDDQIEELVAKFDCMTTIANLGTKQQTGTFLKKPTQANVQSSGGSPNGSTTMKDNNADSQILENNESDTDISQIDIEQLTMDLRQLDGDSSKNLENSEPKDNGILSTEPTLVSIFESNNVKSISEQRVSEPDDQALNASTSAEESAAPKSPKPNQKIVTRKQFHDIFLKNVDKVREKSLLIFSNLNTLEKANLTRTFYIANLELTYKLFTLYDGGVVVKVYVGYVTNDSNVALHFTSCVFLDTLSVLTARLAMEDAIKLLPGYIDGSLCDPISEYSLEFLNRRSIFKNEQVTKRYERFSLFCRLCEQHIISPNMVIEHLRSKDHQLLQKRFNARYQLCVYWNKFPPGIQTNFAIYMTNLGPKLQAQVFQFYERCRRLHVNRAFEKLESCIDGYSIRFNLFGSYQTGLMTILNPVIDCYLEIKRIDGTEPTYNEKMKVFRQLPFQVYGRFEAAFVGYLARWETAQFNEKFFFTFDSKAQNAVLSSQLMALYVFLCPPIMHLACVFRAWAAQIGLLKQSNEFRVSGTIFDYMAVFFMQQYYNVPIINERTTRCSIEAFLRKPVKYQLQIVQPLFETFAKNAVIPPLPVLFMNMILFYGCGFNYQHCIQITTAERVNKEKLGFRTAKIVDVFNNASNLFFMRPEHAFHLDNMIFFATCEFLSPPNSPMFKNLAIEFISSTSNRDYGYQYLIFTDDVSIMSHLGSNFMGGLGAWKQDVVPRVELKCHFCRKTNHTERYCFTLKLEPINGLPILANMHNIFSNLIDYHFKQERITDDQINEATTFIDRLENIIFVRKGIVVKLEPFGSLKSGFGTRNSDIDLCISFSKNKLETEVELDKRIDLLCTIGDALQCEGGFDISYVFGAKVPILKFNYSDGDQHFKADICVSNQLALYNTKMLATYVSLDERVAPLGIAIKKWASVFSINDAATHTFSSYSLSMMLIHYLQRIEPPVLPYLQNAKEFGLTQETLDSEYEIQFARPDAAYMEKFRKNTMSLGELFIAFFDYFAAFNWQDQVVQVRSSDPLWKLDKEWHRSTMSIEDPFDLSHNLVAGIRLANSLDIFKCINIMQNEFRNRMSIFFEKDFNFDANEFQLLKAKVQRNNYSGPACFKCGQIGHNKHNCPRKNGKPAKSTNEAGTN